MMCSLWSRSNPMDHQLPNNNDDSLIGRLGLKAVLVFCSNRALRGGSRQMVQIVALLLTMFILFRLLPEHLDSSGFAGGYKHIITWGVPNLDVAGELRIVVFGAPDLLGSAPDPAERRTTWTEQLCEELNCSSHLSFVPADSSRGLLSNSIYGKELDVLQLISDATDVAKSPSSDFRFISEQYPVPSKVPDLATQVEQFLAMPPPKVPPRETLWVFTFGTWEIWNLAAMPKGSADAVMNETISHLFTKIEHLYRMSLDPESPAFSDFWSNATDSQIRVLTAPDAAKKVDHRRLESFRILIPRLLDPSLTPGWHTRPLPTFPHSRAEQTRRAAELTSQWNSELFAQLDKWKARASRKPDELMDQPDRTVEIGETNTVVEYVPEELRPAATQVVDGNMSPVIYAPYPRRNGWRSNPAIRILDAMTEEEMQRAGISDSQGRGKLTVNDTMRFLDVWTPCIKTRLTDVSDDSLDSLEECDSPDDHLFLDPFTVGQRAIEGLAKSMAKEVQDHLFLRNVERPGRFYR